MNSQQFGNAYQTEHFQATVLEFENGKSMLLVLPEKGVTAEDLLKKDMEETFAACEQITLAWCKEKFVKTKVLGPLLKLLSPLL